MKSSNPYQSSSTSELTLEQKLIAEQSLIGTVIGSVIGAVPGFTLYLLLAVFPFYALLGYFIPGLFIGLFAGFMGRGIDKIHRVISALVTLLAVIVVALLFDISKAAIGLSLINCIVAAFCSTRWLTREQEDAVFDYKIGYKPDRPND